MAYYFIGGLGCNVYYPQDFFKVLKLPIVYLDLYGQKFSKKQTWKSGLLCRLI